MKKIFFYDKKAGTYYHAPANILKSQKLESGTKVAHT